MVGFPLFTSLALVTRLSAAHASVIAGLLPAATAPRAVARAGERPGRGVLARGRRRARRRARLRRDHGRPAGSTAADVLPARGRRARRARVRGGRRALARLRRLADDLLGARVHRAVHRSRSRSPRGDGVPDPDATAVARASPTSPSISMFLGFFAWYHGLALGGVAKIGQVQLAQPRADARCGPRCCSARPSPPRCSWPRSPCSPASLATQRTRAGVSRRRTPAAACPRPSRART